MSEYQYYEFRTVNRQLTPAQRQAVDKLSSHGHTTSTSFSVDYSWGDFKHNPDDVLARYFDAFFYIANWGSVQLKFRYPKELIDVRSLEPYCFEEEMVCDYSIVGNDLILTFEVNSQAGDWGWIEDTTQLSDLLPLYDAILQGDYRVLYLMWLRMISDGIDYSETVTEETLEPPVPPKLDKLSSALIAFVKLMEIDETLLAAAAKGAAPAAPASQTDEAAALAALSPEECIDFLQRLLAGETHLAHKLKQHMELTAPATGYSSTGTRTAGQLLAAREAIKQRQAKAAAAAAEAKRRAEMDALAARGDGVWQEVEALVQDTKTAEYRQAAKLLFRLGELARSQGTTSQFMSRLDALKAKYKRRTTFMRELKSVQL
ncbi:MAG: hypothetical protein KDE46_04990 [Caldilineaceae bacterium]|nr:hypothetical protein [Caldilineaceae bacterium]